MAKTEFQVCAYDNPAMPTGSGVISRHRTRQAAERAREREIVRFQRSLYSAGGGYLSRIIVRVDPDGTEKVVA